MADPFASPKRRLARAKEHIENLKRRVETWADSKPYTRLIERNARGFEEHKIKLSVDIPDDVTDIAYEALEALRSVLDQATYAIAIACKSKRPDLIHFPVAESPLDLENILKGRLKDFPPDILTLFRAFKPYQSGNIAIWALNRIRREGTHRLIIPVGTGSAGGIVHNLVTVSAFCDVLPPDWDSGKNEVIFLRTIPGADLKYDIELTFFVAFGPVEGVAGESVLDILDLFSGEVERITLAMEAEARRIGLIAR